MTKPIEFETERLWLRQWRIADRIPFAALNADPRVMEFFPALLTCVESDAIADLCQSVIRERGWGVWAVELKKTGDFIGMVGLHNPSDQLPFTPCTEILWRLAFDYWGYGFATEASRRALQFGFEQLGLLEIVSFTALGNIRSRAVMKRLGMIEANETFEHPALPVGHELRKHCLYRLSHGQWRANAAYKGISQDS